MDIRKQVTHNFFLIYKTNIIRNLSEIDIWDWDLESLEDLKSKICFVSKLTSP